MAARNIYNIKSIQERNYKILDLGKYSPLMGRPENRFTAMMYGESGSGKSVFTLQFADYYSHYYGKVLYNSHEEGVNQTIKDRITDFDIKSPKLWVGNKLDYEQMCHKIERNYYRLVVVDSVQYMNFSFEQLKEMRERFKKRHLSIVLVSFGQSQGKPAGAGAIDLLHASDIKLFFKNGTCHSHGRYLSKPVSQRLFVPG